MVRDKADGHRTLGDTRLIRSRPRWLWIVAGVSMVVALVAGTGWLVAQGTRGAEIANDLALPVAALSVLAAVIFGVLAPTGGAVEGGQKLAGAARELAGAVRKQEAVALVRLVGDAGDTHPADVGFAQPGLLYWDGGDRRGRLAEIEPYYQGLGRGRLVVLGAGGSGKTVLAITLIRDLAAAVVATAPSPQAATSRVVVPVRLSLPAFDPAPGEENLEEVPAERVAARLEQWLANHLVTAYGITEKTAAALVTQGWVLPVLDGLDEMDPAGSWPARAAAVLRGLNHPTAVGLRRMILTCRSNRYAELTGRPLEDAPDAVGGGVSTRRGSSAGGQTLVVQDATVLCLEPLTARTVIKYLTYRFPDPAGSGRCEPRWHPVIARLTADRTGDPLVGALRSPLRLFLTVTGYRDAGSDPAVLTRATTTAQLDEHLFGLLVPALTAQHPRESGRHYTDRHVQRWLSTLAHHLRREEQNGRSGSDLRLDQLWAAAGDRAPRYLTTAVLATTCAALWVIGVRYLIRVWFPHDLLDVSAGAIVAQVAETAWRSLSRSVDLQRVDLGALRTAAGLRRLAVWLTVWLAVGLEFGRLVGLEFGLAVGLAVGLTVGLMWGLAGGLAGRLEVRPSVIDRPHRLVSQGLAHAGFRLAGGLAGGLAVGLAFGLVVGSPVGFPVRPAVGLAVGSLPGLAYGVVRIADSPWPRYTVACLLLARRGELPRRPARFLDWAYDAGLMRLSGIAVQFRHREFQAWLTRAGPEPSGAARSAPPPPAEATPAGTSVGIRWPD